MDLAYLFSFWAKYACVDSAVWHTALQLNLFDHILSEAEGYTSLATLAEQAGASLRGTRIIVEPLVSQKVLKVNAQKELAIRHEYVASLRDEEFVEQLKNARSWWGPAQLLTTAVRNGNPVTEEGQVWDILQHYQTLFATTSTLSHPSKTASWVFDSVARNFLRTQALVCSSELNLFTHLANGPVLLPQIATDCETSVNGMKVLLDTLTNLGILHNEADRYHYQANASNLLHPKSIASYKQSLGITNMYWQTLGELEAAVKYGQRSLDLHKPELSGQFYLALARYNTSVFSAYFQIIRDVPITLNQDGALANAKVLDVGAGSGVWGAAFAHRDPTIHVTFMDQPQVLAQTRHNVERLKLENETAIWGDDLLLADYGEERFDVIILGQICHTQHPDELPGLFQKLACALRPHGCLVIADQVLNERRDSPIDYLYFGVKEFLSTQGDILSLPEYTALLEGAGFNTTQCYRLQGIDVIIGRMDSRGLPQTLGLLKEQPAKV